MRTILFRRALAGMLAASAFYGQSPAAQEQKPNPARYTITDLGTLGGTFSIAFDIDNAGRVAGAADVPSGHQHAFLWDRSHMTDLGTLGGLNSQAGGRAGREEWAILSETATNDPLAENFCGFGTPLICRAGVWRNGVMSMLPTLGGNNAAALTLNSQGQMVGLAEDGVLDKTCISPQKSHFQAVTWEGDQIRKLPPLRGDQVGMALRNNDKDQVVGTSGLCSNTIFGGFGLGPHAVLWDHGAPIYLGNLGDPHTGVAAAINNRGEVFGAAGFPDASLHPFRWTRETGIQDLGLMTSEPADAANTPFDVNDSGEMVGSSCDASLAVCRGYIWQNHVFTDLNTLLPANSPLYVLQPFAINAAGQIAGLALDTNTLEPHAFLATPASGNGPAPDARTSARPMALPENVRKALQRRFPMAKFGAQVRPQ